MRRAHNLRPAPRWLATLLAAGFLSLNAAGVYADDRRDEHEQRPDQGRHEDRADGRDQHDARRGRDVHRRPMRQDFRGGYYEAQPVYAPAPVYYPPQQESGVSLFLPFNLHR